MTQRSNSMFFHVRNLAGLVAVIATVGLIFPAPARALTRLTPRQTFGGQAAGALTSTRIPNQLIVKFKSSPTISFDSEISLSLPFIGKIVLRHQGFSVAGMSGVTELNKTLGVTYMKKLGSTAVIGNMAVVNLPAGADLNSALARYRRDPGVEAAEQATVYQPLWEPNDPYYTKVAGSKDYQWNLRAINMPQAWDISPRGGADSVKVAVIDTGVAFEDYGDFKTAPELASVRFESPQKFSSYDAQCQVGTQQTDAHPNDDEGHGTHVTGTIAQATNNSSHSAGMAFNVTVIPIKADREGCGFSGPDLISGIDWAVSHGADVINMSLGGPEPSALVHDAVIAAVDAGVTVVVADGNNADRHQSPGSGHEGEPPVMYPAAFPEVIGVGATRVDNKRAEYSQYGESIAGIKKPDLVAPGGQGMTDTDSWEACLGNANTVEEFFACIFQDQNNDQLPDAIVQQTISVVDPNNLESPADQTHFTAVDDTVVSGKKCIATDGAYYWISKACGDYNGTSMATPHVAAAAALVLSVNPDLTPAEVKSILTSTARKTVIPGYNAAEHGAGLLDVEAAMTQAGIPPISATPTPKPGQTLIVCPDGSHGTDCQYFGTGGIQDAIDDAADGATVLIKNGTYNNSGIIIGVDLAGLHPPKTNLTVTGESREGVILDGGRSSHVVISTFQNAHNITISNLTLQNGMGGMSAHDDSSVTVADATIKDNVENGVAIFDSATATITGNTILNNSLDGIHFLNTPQATITNNTLDGNAAAGIDLYSCADNNPAAVILNNIITNTTGGYGIGGFCLHDPGKLDNDVITYDLLWANLGDHVDCQGNEFCDGTGFIYQDPLFVDADNGDFHLQPGSPACEGGEGGTYMGAFDCAGGGPTPTPGWTTETNRLLVGDVNGDNTISIEDYAAVAAKYTDFSVIVPQGTPEDVNNDQRITIDDIALTLLHWTDFEIHGDD